MPCEEAHRGRALVEDGVRRIVEEQPRHRDALPLAAGTASRSSSAPATTRCPWRRAQICRQALSVLLLLLMLMLWCLFKGRWRGEGVHIQL